MEKIKILLIWNGKTGEWYKQFLNKSSIPDTEKEEYFVKGMPIGIWKPKKKKETVKEEEERGEKIK